MAQGVVAAVAFCALLCCTFLPVDAVLPQKLASLSHQRRSEPAGEDPALVEVDVMVDVMGCPKAPFLGTPQLGDACWTNTGFASWQTQAGYCCDPRTCRVAQAGQEWTSSRTINNGRFCKGGVAQQPSYQPEPVDCVVEWPRYGRCEGTCGVGRMVIYGTVIQWPAHGGRQCPDLRHEQLCDLPACPPVDCELSEWSEWSTCPVTCGGDWQTRTRRVVKKAQNGGRCVSKYELQDIRRCNERPCPVDCVLSGWSDWTSCSKTCGEGMMYKARQILREAQWGGKECDPGVLQHPCNLGECPVDCKVGEWSEFSECTASCGGGVQTATRKIEQEPKYYGKSCERLEKTQECNTQPCPSNCTVSTWSEWSSCSATCGGGKRSRYRFIEQYAQNGGTCEDQLVESEPCSSKPCPINCEVGPWSKWSECDAPCGGGTTFRTRPVLRPPQNGGAVCPHLEESERCNQRGCPIDCILGPWSGWSECSEVCGGGMQFKTREVLQHEENGGKPCPKEGLVLQRECNTNPCIVNCSMSEWSEWGTCSSTCGGGKKTRTREILVQPDEHYGERCGELTEATDCNTQPCPVNCKMSSWTQWGPCDAACGGGLQRRTRSIRVPATDGGEECPNTEETQTCNSKPCRKDCIVSEWGEFGTCSATCGGGLKSHSRTIIQPAENGGKPCPPLTESVPCNTQECSKDCELSSWGQWGACSATCGGGTQKRTRSVLKEKVGEGQCGTLEEEQACGQTPCPIDCNMTEWSEWGTCSQTCGGGTHTRTRKVLQEGVNGGKACEATEETEECNADACPIDCVVKLASEWTKCSRECGGGQQSQMWIIVREAENGGQECPRNLVRVRSCNEQACTGDEKVLPHVGPAKKVGEDENGNPIMGKDKELKLEPEEKSEDLEEEIAKTLQQATKGGKGAFKGGKGGKYGKGK